MSHLNFQRFTITNIFACLIQYHNGKSYFEIGTLENLFDKFNPFAALSLYPPNMFCYHARRMQYHKSLCYVNEIVVTGDMT
ncbi:hypothetical protein V1477_002717 [Vespula maculifrons]|uniref:Uncharacterized protein n=1 Tax=Vespula maculifrons TaxID=7453 RepID=A0ABD2CVK7_VESMC